MAIPENPIDTTLRFIDSWSINANPRLESELISLYNETNRRPDVYYFKITPEGLIDSKTKRPVKEFILRNTPLQKIEYEIFINLESWATNSSEGIVLWLSPPCSNYPCAKAIFSRIVYDFEGNKYLANSAILFGSSKTDCLDVFPGFANKSAIRSRLFYIAEDDEELFNQIIINIEKYTKVNSQKNFSSSLDQAKKFANMIEKGISPRIIVDEMQKSRFLGSHPISCPTFNFASTIMLANSRIFSFVSSEFKPGVCRVCKQHTRVGPCNICKECEKKFS